MSCLSIESSLSLSLSLSLSRKFVSYSYRASGIGEVRCHLEARQLPVAGGRHEDGVDSNATMHHVALVQEGQRRLHRGNETVLTPLCLLPACYLVDACEHRAYGDLVQAPRDGVREGL